MIAVLLSIALIAQPVSIEIHYMAPGEKVYLPTPKVWGKGFTLDEYKLLLQMDGDLYTTRQQLRLVDDIGLEWRNIIEEKNRTITSLEKDKKIMTTRTIRLEGNWDTCEKALIEASSGPIWPYIVAIVGASVGIVGIVWGVVAQATANR